MMLCGVIGSSRLPMYGDALVISVPMTFAMRRNDHQPQACVPLYRVKAIWMQARRLQTRPWHPCAHACVIVSQLVLEL
jgi:hypothetical protein